MSTRTTLAAFAAALAVVFGSSVAVGRATGPVGSPAPAPAPAVTTDTAGQHGTEHGGDR